MNDWSPDARWRTVLTATLLLVAGGVMGVVADRLWRSAAETHATPLTADAMAAHLGLSSPEEAELRALLDSLDTEIRAVVQRDPDSLRTVVQSAHRRIEAALPADARAGFRAWMHEHHLQLMSRMHGAHRDHGASLEPRSDSVGDHQHP